MAAVVHQDDVAAAHLLQHMMFDSGAGAQLPIFRAHTPHDGNKADGVNGAHGRGAARAERWTEPDAVIAERVIERFAAETQLEFHARARVKNEVGMRVRVVADLVAGLADFADDVGAQSGVAADHEEGRLHAVAREHVEQARSVRIVRAIVVGERDQVAASFVAALNEGRAVELGVRGHRRPTERAGDTEQARGPDGCADEPTGQRSPFA